MATKTSVYLSDESIEALKKMAKKRGTTMAEALRRSIKTANLLEEETDKGSEVLIKKGRKVKQLVNM
jgi:predicted DNA-binding protein